MTTADRLREHDEILTILNRNLDRHDARIEQNDRMIERMDRQIDRMDRRIEQNEREFKRMIDRMDRRIEQNEREFKRMIDRMDRRIEQNEEILEEVRRDYHQMRPIWVTIAKKLELFDNDEFRDLFGDEAA